MMKYKEHYACFSCRKAFKRKLLCDIKNGYSQARSKKASKCPECGQLMANMGKDFEAPKKKDIKSWTHIQKLYKIGFTFHFCGCSGPAYIPRSDEALALYLYSIKEKYEKELTFWRQRKVPQTAAEKQKERSKHFNHLNELSGNFNIRKDIKNNEVITYWVNKISLINQKIQSIIN